MVNFDNMRKKVYEGLANEPSGHDFAHVMRVFRNAVLIAQSEKGVEIEILKAAALLHDIAYSQGFIAGDYSEESAKIARSMLSTKDFSKEDIERIIYCISHHNVWTKFEKDVPVEVKILRDSDRLDYLGHTGIVKAIAYASVAKKNYIKVLYNSLDLQSTFETTKGKELSKKRIEITKSFIKKLEAEY